ncbi:hypothetical protein ATANTOWER_022045 [Ataeniobius toweri]|uniref:Uncharacterized protein n=1 Tax=Ataeniobius toweri TaxID=208326 RepID=A0ABU7AQH4_9TELE|nr:hypothetical protein [Ataeniobius toweri]
MVEKVAMMTVNSYVKVKEGVNSIYMTENVRALGDSLRMCTLRHHKSSSFMVQHVYLYYVVSSFHQLNDQTHSYRVQPFITRKYSHLDVTHFVCGHTTHFD